MLGKAARTIPEYVSLLLRIETLSEMASDNRPVIGCSNLALCAIPHEGKIKPIAPEMTERRYTVYPLNNVMRTAPLKGDNFCHCCRKGLMRGSWQYCFKKL